MNLEIESIKLTTNYLAQNDKKCKNCRFSKTYEEIDEEKHVIKSIKCEREQKLEFDVEFLSTCDEFKS